MILDNKGFILIKELSSPEYPDIFDPRILLSCLDPSIIMNPLYNRFKSIIITSGTLSPINFYTKILNLSPIEINSINMTVPRKCLFPLIITSGSDLVSCLKLFRRQYQLDLKKDWMSPF